ncbi:MAG: hypothetical protein KGJ69_16465, partial [Thermoplasmata archaeon]|nr:hypothetical protein [Thermoplasmata archaeon]
MAARSLFQVHPVSRNPTPQERAEWTALERLAKTHPPRGRWKAAMALTIFLLIISFLGLGPVPVYPAASGDLSDALPNVVVGNQWAVNTTFWVFWSTDVGPIEFIVYTCTSNFSTVYAEGMSGCQHLSYAYVQSAMSGSAWFSVPPNGAAMLEWRDPPGCNPCA